MRKQSGTLGILSCMVSALVGCGEASFEENGIDEGPIAEAEQALETSNMLSANALEMNALEMNALEMNALEMNALEMNALEMNGLMASFNNTEPATALAHATRGELFEELFRYIYSCAMPANMSMQLPVVRNGQTKNVTFQGSLGLAPQWATGACDADCQHWVSACVLARVNAYHIPVKISLRGNHPALTTTQAELDSYPIFEGRFYGNIFDRNELKSPFNVCRGTGADMGHITSRACAKTGGYCSMNVTGDCSTQCNAAGGTCAATNSANAIVNVPAIEVWLAQPAPSACGNGVCEAGETQASCLYDCTPAATVDHEPAGSSATTMVSVALNGANAVYAGITTSTTPLTGLSALDTGTKTARDMFIVRGNADGTYGAVRRIALPNENPVAMDAAVDAAGAGNIALVTAGVGEGTLRILNASTLASKLTVPLYSGTSGYRIESVKVEGTSYVHTYGYQVSYSGGIWSDGPSEYRKYSATSGNVVSSRGFSIGQNTSLLRMTDGGGMRLVHPSASSTLDVVTFGPPGQLGFGTTVSLAVPGLTNIVPTGMEEGVFVAGNGTTTGGQPGAFIGRVYGGNNSWAWLTTVSPDPERAIEIHSMQVRGHVVIVMGKFKGPLDFRGSTPTQVPSARAGVNGNEDVFIAAYEISTGALAWVRTYGGPGVDNPDAFTVDETGRLWLFGRFVGTPRIEGSYVAGHDGDTGVDSMRIVAGPISLAQSSPIIAGPWASYAVRDGQLWSWGQNADGNLGLTTTGLVLQPTVALSGVVKAAAGLNSVAVLRSDGSVWVAGNNYGGEYGNGSNTTPSPKGLWAKVPGLSSIVDIAAGRNHVLALQSNGKVWAWGSNQYGELGLGHLNNTYVPTEVPSFSGTIAVGVAAFYYSSAVVRADGSIYVFGRNDRGNLDPAAPSATMPTPVLVPGMSNMIAVALGRDSVLGLHRDGTVWVRGNNADGALGNGTRTALTETVQVQPLKDVVSISNGWGFSTAVRRDGTVWSWGYNAGGALGTLSEQVRTTPAPVSGVSEVVQVVSGYYHTTTRNRRGDMSGFGNNAYGQITGAPAQVGSSILATRVNNLSDATSISASRNAVFVVRNGDILRSCGNGALGDSSVKMRPYFENVFGLSNMKQAAAGQEHGLAVSNTGNVYVWGRNVFGQLGDGTMAERQGPKLLPSLSGITKVAAGDWFSLALAGNGTAYSFGDNSKLALGISGVGTSSTPLALSSYGTVVDIAAGANHGLLANATGQLYAWGNDSNGQLGRGTTTGTNQLPQLVFGLSGATITKIAAAENHSLALSSAGQVWVFGNDTYGQLGRGTTVASRPAAATMSGVSNAIAIATSARHSLILRADGTVMAVGSNSSGQLGDGTTTSRSTPIVISGLSNVVAIAAGDSHSMVLKSDGTVWTFGSRANGQLCDGKTQGNALAPTQVMGL